MNLDVTNSLPVSTSAGVKVVEVIVPAAGRAAICLTIGKDSAMRFVTAASRQGFAICLTAGLAVDLDLGGWAATASRQAAAEEASAPPAAPVSSPKVDAPEPTLHADIYRRLAAPVRVDFKRMALGEVLHRLAKSTGIDIEVVDDSKANANPKDFECEITLKNRDPVTLEKAIQMALTYAGGYRITLSETGVRIVSVREAANQYVLETHELWGASDYTTRMRTRFIEQVRREIAGGDWGRADGPWIVPSRSVFGVDVYHKPEVQRQIDELWQREHLGKQVAAAENSESAESPQTLNVKKASPEQIHALAERLREKYPFVSLADRLDYERDRSAAKPPSVSPQVERRLAARERPTGRRRPPELTELGIRAESLKQLHSDEVEKFVSRPGFGLSRNLRPDPEYLPLVRLPPRPLASAEIDPPSAELPVSLPIKTPLAPAGPAALPALDRLESLHEIGLLSFLSSMRFGYVKDREHVAGFGSHGFFDLPRLERLPPAPSVEPTEQWAMRRLELVSLLKHDTPRVYVSDSLPSMDELQEAPTRPLNTFETDAIPRLVESEDIVARATTNRIEMVGAIRAAKQCTACHEVQRGQLLGAFTYTLVRDPWISSLADGSANRSESIAQ
jgi:hypothetical protein